jgi:hypothetical protein
MGRIAEWQDDMGARQQVMKVTCYLIVVGGDGFTQVTLREFVEPFHDVRR